MLTLEIVMKGREERRRPGELTGRAKTRNEQVVGYPQPGLESKEPTSRLASVVTLGDLCHLSVSVKQQ